MWYTCFIYYQSLAFELCLQFRPLNTLQIQQQACYMLSSFTSIWNHQNRPPKKKKGLVHLEVKRNVRKLFVKFLMFSFISERAAGEERFPFIVNKTSWCLFRFTNFNKAQLFIQNDIKIILRA